MFIFIYQSINLLQILTIQETFISLCPMLYIALPFMIVIAAESARPPFDLPEAEAELVSGYHVEFAGMAFGGFFLAEYGSFLFMSTFLVLILFCAMAPVTPYLVGPGGEPGFWIIFESQKSYEETLKTLAIFINSDISK